MGSSLSHTEMSPAASSTTCLLSLPNELLLLISTRLDRASHIHSLILTNRRLNFLLTPTLHTYARLPVSISPKETLTSLQWASMNGHMPLIRLLLSHPDNKDLDTVATHTRNLQSPSCATALHHAIARGDEEIMKLLLDAGARCDIQDSFGDTAVHAAVTRANSLAGKRRLAWLPLPFRGWETETRLLRVLLEYGPPLDIGNNKGDTPLHVAVSGAVPCAATVAEMLLGSGVQVNVRNGWKYTPLHVAAMTGVVGVVEVLMRGGADIDADGEWCLTPGKLAEARGFTGVVRALGRVGC